jgi:hypothetical protein
MTIKQSIEQHRGVEIESIINAASVARSRLIAMADARIHNTAERGRQILDERIGEWKSARYSTRP